jgi:hypothetical protein
VNDFIDKADFPTRFDMAFDVAKTVRARLVSFAPFPFPSTPFPPAHLRSSLHICAYASLAHLRSSLRIGAYDSPAHLRPSPHICAYTSLAHLRSSLRIGAYKIFCALASLHAHRRIINFTRYGVRCRARAHAH